MTKEEFRAYLDSHKPKDIWKNDFSHILKGSENDYSSTQFFYSLNKKLPSILHLEDFDANKFLTQFLEDFSIEPERILRSDYYTLRKEIIEPGRIVIIVSDEIHLLLKLTSFCASVYYSNTIDASVLDYIKKAVKEFPIEELVESNLYFLTEEKGQLKGHLVKTPDFKNLDISLMYNDDFKPISDVIIKRLSTENDKGLVLLHGLAGTGKTTYLRYLMNIIKKKFIFLSPECAFYLDDSQFIKFLLDYRNSIIILEDAEEAIKARSENTKSATSNLLSLGDGILSDSLNIQVLITFNTDLKNIDKALLRKGRLISRYDFKELNKNKAQKLSDSLGFNTKIETDMTLADIFNQNEIDFTNKKKNNIGFANNKNEK